MTTNSTQAIPSSDAPENPSKSTILIADDDEEFRTFVMTLLKREGFGCNGAANAESAYSMLQEDSYELIIADINMPGNEQLEFLKLLHESKIDVPVILVTGYPSMESAIDSIQLPVSAYLVKPFEPSELLKHTHQALLRSKLLAGIRESRSRIGRWQSQLQDLESLVQMSSPDFSARVPIDFYISLTVQNIIDPLVDLANLSQTLVQQKTVDKSNVCNLFECPRLSSHERILTSTVEILETTKKSFKSKTVANLRAKLEKYLETST